MRNRQSVKLIASRAFGAPDADTPLEEIIGYRLKSLSHAVRHGLDEGFRQARLLVSFAHIPVLFVARREPGIPGAQLARRLSVTAQSMHTILKRLERQGYIERKPHPHNRRAECWFVTQAGVRQLDLSRRAGRAVLDRMLAFLNESDKRQLLGLVERCLLGLEPERALAHTSGAAAPARRTRAARRRAAEVTERP
jgi:DNA-binding MarR family transcriptional regulator